MDPNSACHRSRICPRTTSDRSQVAPGSTEETSSIEPRSCTSHRSKSALARSGFVSPHCDTKTIMGSIAAEPVARTPGHSALQRLSWPRAVNGNGLDAMTARGHCKANLSPAHDSKSPKERGRGDPRASWGTSSGGAAGLRPTLFPRVVARSSCVASLCRVCQVLIWC